MQPDELKTIRKGLGMTQEAFAGALGMSRKAVVEMEGGKAPIEARTAMAAQMLADTGTDNGRVSIGAWSDKFVVIATTLAGGRRRHVVQPVIYETVIEARAAAATYALDHGLKLIDL